MNAPDRPLRLLHLVVLRFWSAVAWHAVTMGVALARDGHACWVAGQRGTPVLAEAERAGLLVPEALRLPPIGPWSWCASVSRLRRFVDESGIDAAFVHTGAGQTELFVARGRGPLAVVRVRADARAPRHGAAQRWIYRRAAERVAYTGAHVAALLEPLGLPAERRVHLPPGFDLAAVEQDASLTHAAARAEVARRHALPPDVPWLAIIGRLSPVKGHAVLIDACAQLVQRGLDSRLLVVGAEKEVSGADLVARARQVGLGERLLLTGAVQDPLRYAAAADVGVVCSLGSEAVSRSALEFMAACVPVVATRVGILPEVVGRPEQLVPPGEAGALAAALERVLAAPDRGRALGEAGRERVRACYSLDRLGAGAEAIARAAIETRRRARGEGR